jgi:hypothetical protein
MNRPCLALVLVAAVLACSGPALATPASFPLPIVDCDVGPVLNPPLLVFTVSIAGSMFQVCV